MSVASPRRGGLGRGLEALIPPRPADPGDGEVAPEPVPAHQGAAAARGYLRTLPVQAISPNPRQPRTVFDPAAGEELVRSIREVGLLQPVVVREREPGSYELVVGERRWRACRSAGLAEIPAIVRPTGDDELLRDALLENLHRQQLNPLEEAAGYAQLLEDFGVTHDELARRLGRSRAHVTNTTRLLHLPAGVQRRVAAGVLSAGHARALLSLPDPAAQERLAARVVAEGMSVRAVEEAVAVGEPGGDPRDGRRRGRSGAAGRSVGLEPVAAALSDHLDTRVRVEAGRSKGRIVIEFGSVQDLGRLVAVLAPEVAGQLPELAVDPA